MSTIIIILTPALADLSTVLTPKLTFSRYVDDILVSGVWHSAGSNNEHVAVLFLHEAITPH